MASKYKMTLCFLGCGYVGGPTMSIIAQKCPDIKVIGTDVITPMVEAWQSDNIPIYEPGLFDIVKEVRGKNLTFTTDIKASIQAADIIFVCVGTPTKTQGVGAGSAANLNYIEAAARMIADYSEDSKIVVEKSTVPVRTSQAVERILKANTKSDKTTFDMLSNPEFLAEGTAVQDLLEPDRILIGGKRDEAIEKLVWVYNHWVPRENIITTNLWSSELSKLVANAFLAQRISSINAVSAICEASGANVREVANAIGKDSRIGPKFLNSSVGFGGSCFQKDILNLVYLCEGFNLPDVAQYWRSVVEMNDYQRKRFTRKILHTMFDTISDKDIAIFGFAFKKDTGDTRESPAIYVCRDLISEKARLHVFDPQVSEERMRLDLDAVTGDPETVKKLVTYHKDPYECAQNCHAIVILTEWDEFKTYDYGKLYESMIKPSFCFDGRGLVNASHLKQIGFEVFVIGQPQQ